jgi:UDP-glucose 4-epimerase
LKYAIIGGFGFLGNEIVRQLISDGNEVFIIDNNYKSASDIDDIKSVKTYFIDIRNYDQLRKDIIKERPDVIIHTAAIHYIPECNNNPTFAFEVNVTGTLNVLRIVQELKPTHFVHLSSGAVYADSDELLKEEESEINVGDIYGMTKLINEQMTSFYSNQNEITKFSVARMFNIIGPRETNAHIIPEIIEQLKLSNVLKLGNIKPRRDMIYVEDAARACILLSNRKIGSNFEIVNVSSATDISMSEVVEIIKKKTKRNIIVEIDKDKFRQVDKLFQKGDNSKLHKITGFKISNSIENSIYKILKYENIL